MNKNQIIEIHSVLLPLWRSNTVEDVRKDVSGWNINDDEARQRIKIVADAFREEAEKKLADKIEYLAEWEEECEARGEDNDNPDAAVIRTITNQYVRAFSDVVWDEESYPMAEEIQPSFITEVEYLLRQDEIKRTMKIMGQRSAQARLGKLTPSQRSMTMKELRAKGTKRKTD